MTLLHEVPVVVVLTIFTVAPSQASDAVGGVKVGVAVQSKVAFCPGVPIVGVGQLTVTFFVHTDGAISVLSKVMVRVTV